MRTIKKINLPMLTNMEMAGYGQECAYATELLGGVTEMDSVVQNFNKKLDEYQKRMMLKGTGAYTDRIHAIVKTAVDTWTGLRCFVNGMTYSPDTAVSQAAVSVLGKIDFYGTVAYQTYDVTFGKVLSLVSDITDSEASTVGIVYFVDKLRQANEDFVNESAARKDYRKMHKDAVATSRKSLDDAYHALVNFAESLVVANGIARYEAFINRINELVIEHAQRKSSDSKSKAAATGDNAEKAAVAANAVSEDNTVAPTEDANAVSEDTNVVSEDNTVASTEPTSVAVDETVAVTDKMTVDADGTVADSLQLAVDVPDDC